MIRTTALALAAVAALSASAASAATVSDFVVAETPGSVTSITGTVGGIGFTATAETVDDRLRSTGAANVTFVAGGFGVDGQSGTSPHAQSDPNRATTNTIDGIGVDKNELLRITFDREVSISALRFGMIDPIDDVFIRMGDFAGRFGFGGDTSLNAGAVASAIDQLSLRGTTLDIVAGIPNATCTTRGSRHCGGATDLFTFTGVAFADVNQVAPVPLPAGGLLLLTSLAAAGGLARRRANAA